MNIIQLLKEDHVQLNETMSQLEKNFKYDSNPTEKLFHKFKDFFDSHDMAEEKIAYPAFKEVKELAQLVLKGYQAHHSVELGILELKLLPFSSESWLPKFLVIRDSILTHVAEEESVLLPKVEKHFDKDRLIELAQQVEEQRK